MLITCPERENKRSRGHVMTGETKCADLFLVKPLDHLECETIGNSLALNISFLIISD